MHHDHFAHWAGLAVPELAAPSTSRASAGAAGAALGGLNPPPNEEAPGVMAEGFRDQEQDDETDFHAAGIADQAALAIEGEAYAQAYLDRLRAGTAQPGNLAALLSFLTGEMLNGACRVIEKALGDSHHA